MQCHPAPLFRISIRLLLAALPALANATPVDVTPDSCAALLCLTGPWQAQSRCVSAVAQVATARARGQAVADCALDHDPSAMVTLKWLTERRALADRHSDRVTAQSPAHRNQTTTPAVASTPPTPEPAPAVPIQPVWEVLATDATLAQTLTRWTRAAGMRLQWDAPRTFLVTGPTVLHGDFETALEALLASPGIRHSDLPLEACIYANQPPLVRITRLGEQARLCNAP